MKEKCLLDIGRATKKNSIKETLEQIMMDIGPLVRSKDDFL